MKICVLGNFDGMHLGHRKLFEAAEKIGGNAVCAFTFYPFEGAVFPLSVKEGLLSEVSPQIYLARFELFRDKTPEEFTDYLKACGFDYAVCGFNYTFGRGKSGSADDLMRLFGGNVTVVPEVREVLDGEEVTVSSTLIKKLLAEGRIADANRFMGHNYILHGKVETGRMVGRKLGFPTLNQSLKGLTTPKNGVYGGEVSLGGRKFRCLTNIGSCPTIGEEEIHAETHVIGFSGELYDKCVKIELTSFIREERKFASADELKAQIKNDIALLG